MNFNVPVKPEILLWARQSIGYSIKDAAGKIKVNEVTVSNWEKGVTKPTYTQIEKLASVYKRPVAVFLLPKPPKEHPLPKDFRTELSIRHKPLTPKSFLTIRKARKLQLSAIELIRESGSPLKLFSIEADLRDDPESLAKEVRKKIVPDGFDISEFLNREDAFKAWKRFLEDHGILVFQISVSQREIKGFSLLEAELPAIVINKTDDAHSRIFSLFHELAHVILNEAGICDMKEEMGSPDIEKFCNHFAGAFLVPAKHLLSRAQVKQQESYAWNNKTLKSLADEFRVSKEVVLRRLLILGKTTNNFYKYWREENIKEYIPFGRRGDPVKTCVQERGEKYVSLVLNAYSGDKISALDAADYLGVKINQIEKARKYIANT